ncbi:MAG: transketolase [Gammaproteobacteria bacterium]|nr:transketolase [Gammaproteobacteria bacterium]NIR81900.1 transketolase [Gammaproteobacteria bacterium]NIR88732.1 transketolase [Gammaproteobacteria bacterium]NIU03008.1 transketolase [Gammaproteobacteria bacterium]NIV50529.1 transketolase [Gammaproteobacteria bacterium]
MPSPRELANAIRALSMDAVENAKSGHPGMPMGMADIAQVLWNDYLSHNPLNPDWINRDRFILSNGHGCMLQYALLHLTGYDLPLDEIKRFRQLGSKTPGHPEYGVTPGVETTTGPLGQGLANGVGMAIAEKVLAAQFNRPGHSIVDHFTYVFVGDGCLMEGISHEACSLAGTLGLGKLIVLYDDNGISIDGEVQGWFTENVPGRFSAYGWHVVPDVDGHDRGMVTQALEQARAITGRPSLICCKTVIGWGAPNKQGTEACHGAPLGPDEVALAREAIGWSHGPFVIPDEIYAGWDARAAGARRQAAWEALYAAYRTEYPALASEFERRLRGGQPVDWEAVCDELVQDLDARAQNIATRKASQQVLDALGPALPELIGGSADLTGSNLTTWSGSRALGRDAHDGNYVYYGVREFAMSAILNGLALHGGFIPFGGTFLTFSDYARNAVRLAALMGAGSVFVYTHDSIGLGEDGPTHQAVEHATSLRLIPNLSVWRPCDALESAVAWRAAIERRDGPTCLLFTRQSVDHQPRTREQIKSIRRGGYVLFEPDAKPDALIIATGSEVGIALDAARLLGERGAAVRVVSLPSVDTFEAQDERYREAVLPAAVRARVSVEAGVTHGWHKYVGSTGRTVGIDTYGESAPAAQVFKHFGFTAEAVARAVEDALSDQSMESAWLADKQRTSLT